jgi:hypothetical protein
MRSPRRALYEQIRKLLDERDRLVNLQLTVRVYRRHATEERAIPGELLPGVWGGIWDQWKARYVDDAPGKWKPAEVSIHPGQRDLVLFGEPGVSRVLLLGAPGGGKTEGICVRAICNALTAPGKVHGVIAPTTSRLHIVWRKILSLLRGCGWKGVHVRKADHAIELPNGSILQFVAAKRYSESVGSPIAGFDFWSCVEDEQQNIDDESLYEVDARGRQNADYLVCSSATNERIPEFQQRLEFYRNYDKARIIRMRGDDNVFVPRSHWEKLKAQWPKDEYERRILGLDVPCQDVVYPQFSISENVAPLPMVGRDVTSKLVLERFPTLFDRDYILGTDLGILVTTSIVLKAFAMPDGRRAWWAVGEITTASATAEYHAEDIKRWCGRAGIHHDRVVVIADPHSRQADRKSDYTLLRKAGLTVVKSSPNQIEKKHRYSMVNSLLCDAKGHRALFIGCDEYKRAECKKLVESFFNLRFGRDGNPLTYHKGTRDLTHWSDALGYGLYPFEQIRGTQSAVVVKPEKPKLWESEPHSAFRR